MQLDIFLPGLSLAFEYQGEQHYHDIEVFGPSKQYSDKDLEKRAEFTRNGIAIIEIPYWWDTKEDSLIATILGAKPELRDLIYMQNVK